MKTKTSLLTCSPKEDSAQSAHPVWSVFDVRMKKFGILGYKKVRPVKILSRLRECAGLSQSSLGAHVRRYFFCRCGLNVNVLLMHRHGRSLCVFISLFKQKVGHRGCAATLGALLTIPVGPLLLFTDMLPLVATVWIGITFTTTVVCIFYTPLTHLYRVDSSTITFWPIYFQ